MEIKNNSDVSLTSLNNYQRQLSDLDRSIEKIRAKLSSSTSCSADCKYDLKLQIHPRETVGKPNLTEEENGCAISNDCTAICTAPSDCCTAPPHCY